MIIRKSIICAALAMGALSATSSTRAADVIPAYTPVGAAVL
jgi:hypothetical protein